MESPRRARSTTAADLPVVGFSDRGEWEAWLGQNHATSSGVWMRIARKRAATSSVSYPDALEVALCYGWIDGQKSRLSDDEWLQRFTPRQPRSTWSKTNRAKAEALIDDGMMQPAGLAEVERARRDGRWRAAYDGQRNATVPDDLAAALAANAAAREFFATLDSRNRYAVLFRIHAAKKAETRARRIRQFVEMLAERRKIHE